MYSGRVGIKDSVLHASYDASYGQQLADTSILVTANFVVAMNIITANKLPTSCEHESAARPYSKLQVCMHCY